MKHIDKKLLGITAVGLSAWVLVIALVLINKNTTAAMLTPASIPAQQSAPQILGATTFAQGVSYAASVSQMAPNHKGPSILPVIIAVSAALVGASVIIAIFAQRKRSTKT